MIIFCFYLGRPKTVSPWATWEKNGEVEGVSIVWDERLIRYEKKESKGGRVEPLHRVLLLCTLVMLRDMKVHQGLDQGLGFGNEGLGASATKL